MRSKDLILQLSIPFCFHRCAYCTSLMCKYDERLMPQYIKAMQRDIESASGEMEDYVVRAVSVEGGSPVLAGPALLRDLLRSVRKHFTLADDIQISLQTMPGDYSRALMQNMRDSGVNHWIFGIVTANYEEHRLLERPYRFDALSMADMAIRTFGVRDISFDILYGIPGQSERSLLHTLESILAYKPDHITLYPLRWEKGSAFYVKKCAGILSPPSPDEMSGLRDAVLKVLRENGFSQYTDYDFCLPGKENRFRLAQKNGVSQLGIGYGALTKMDGICYTNGHSLEEYLEHSDDISITASNIIQLT